MTTTNPEAYSRQQSVGVRRCCKRDSESPRCMPTIADIKIGCNRFSVTVRCCQKFCLPGSRLCGKFELVVSESPVLREVGLTLPSIDERRSSQNR